MRIAFGKVSLKDLTLELSELIQDELKPVDVDLAVLVHIAAFGNQGGEAIRAQTYVVSDEQERPRGGCILVTGCLWMTSLTSLGQNPLVNAPNGLHRALVDVQVGQMRQEIISDEDGDKDEVIDDFFERVWEGKFGGERGKLEVEIFSQ